MGSILVPANPALWAPPAPNVRTYAGSTLTTSAPYHPRDGAALHKIAGRYVLWGGWWSGGTAPWSPYGVTTNEIWSSLDRITWTLDREHTEDPPLTGPNAIFSKRHTIMSGLFKGYGWVLGSDISDPADPVPKSDVWRSLDGRFGWQRVAASCPWGPVYLGIFGVLGDYMHVMGGFRNNVASKRHYRSRDGVNWERLSDMPFARAGVVQAVTLHGKLFIVGGASGHFNDRVYHNDVWAYCAAGWRQMSSGAPWPGRFYNGVAAYDDRLWSTTGAGGANLEGCSSSQDYGQTWVEHTPPWGASHADGITATEEDGITVATGNLQGQNVFSMKRAA